MRDFNSINTLKFYDDRIVKVAEYACKKKMKIVASEDMLNNIAAMVRDHRETQTGFLTS